MYPKVDTQNNQIDEKRLLKILEVAHYLNISRSLAYRLIQTGEIPAVRLGKSVRVRPQDLEAYIQANISGGASIHPSRINHSMVNSVLSQNVYKKNDQV